ncbi:MAG: HD domain-containing protein [Lachnospiraceae bacterium]|nr:HD domain-containing protein [Lachnospiraceae bacterium]MBR1567740.1 HD domain-containing protein [Lachnospiraceae bacterium]
MSDTKAFTNIRSLLGGLARAMNLVNHNMENHHERTAYFAYFIAREMKLSMEDTDLVIYAALLHDIGSIIQEKELTVQEIEQSARKYAEIGANMISDLPEYTEISKIIASCQTSWRCLKQMVENNPGKMKYARLASIVHLSDVAVSCIMEDQRILNQVDNICRVIEYGRGSEFNEEAVDAFLTMRNLELVWLDVMHNPYFLGFFIGEVSEVSLQDVRVLTKLMSRIIDYRSSFTAMHSAGVAASTRELAVKCGMSEDDCIKIEIAGYLHDVGKLVVPGEILEKPGKLTDEEFNVVKEHAYYTRLVLMDIDGFEDIANWAGYHHEKLNGNGYPFHLKEEQLDLGSKIMAVADIFSALTETRPYRAGMEKDQVIKIMREDAARGDISGEIVEILIRNYEEIDSIRDQKSKEAGARYFASLGTLQKHGE